MTPETEIAKGFYTASAGQRRPSFRPERPLSDAQQSCGRVRPVYIVDPPLSIGERMSANDPERS